MGAVVIIGGEPMARFSFEEVKAAGFEEIMKRTEDVIYVAARGNGRSMGALRELLERAERAKELEKMAQSFQISPIPEELIEKMGISAGQYMEMVEILEKVTPKELPSLLSVLEDITEELPAAGVEKRIRALKKELKHAKNPMELKRINQELSAAYAEKKHPERNPYRREVEGKW